MNPLRETAFSAFKAHFGCDATLGVRAPGRVNIIGEHTDYNDGFVLPMAIEYETVIVGTPRTDGLLRLRAENLGETADVNLSHRVRLPETPWADYITGVADELFRSGRTVCGADMLIVGNVPLGCGLSSSAALEMAALAFFESANGFTLDTAEAAQLGQRVENRFLGLNTGIMDQFISRAGRANHALFLDCRTFDYALTSAALENALFVIANTGCPRGLTASKYNERVSECSRAVSALERQLGRSGTKLRDYTLEELNACASHLQPVELQRARHVISENDRTLAACEALRKGNAPELGALMDESDASLRNDYAVTSAELDAMTAIARTLPGCLGARMTGAGFGGCAIALVEKDTVAAFGAALLEHYASATGKTGELYLSSPADGAGPL